MMAQMSTNQWIAISMTLVSAIALVCSKESNLDDKVTYLSDLSSEKPVLRFYEDEFKKYVIGSPKNYSMIVLFTALGRNCEACKPAWDEYELVANSFRHSSQFSSHQLFFAMVDFDEAMNVFEMMKLRTVPAFIHFPAKGKPENHDNLDVQRRGYDANSIIKWIRDCTDIDIKVYRPPNYKKIATFLTLFAMVVGLIYLKRDYLGFIQSKTLWGLICLLFVFTMMSGHMWNHIRKPQMSEGHGNGGPFIEASSGSQYLMESYFVALLYAVIVLGVIMLTAAADTKESVVRRKLVAIIGICLVAFFFSLILAIFMKKNGGYPYPFLLKSLD